MIAEIGAVLPLALAIALSPFPIVAIILLLLSSSPKLSGSAFCLGWIVGLTVPLLVVIAIAESVDVGGSDASHNRTTGVIRIVVGLVLILLAYRQWRRRPEPGAEPETPKWLASIDALTPAKALGLGVVLSAVNPKELLVTVAAGLALAKTDLSGIQLIVPAAVFVLVASLTVIGPLVAYFLVSDRVDAALDTAKKWLIANDAIIMTVVLLLIGVVVFSKGLQAF